MVNELVVALRQTAWANRCVALLRILIGFAFLPAALRKIMGLPFTDPALTGPFHEFLDGFYATGFFYRFVGIVQLVAAVLLCSQRLAALGAALALPVLTAITVFVWSTIGVTPTAIVATLMLAGTVALLVWELPRWRTRAALAVPIHERAWQLCGLAAFGLYVGVCLAKGAIYRPRGLDLGDPAWYVLPLIAVLPVVALVFDLRHRSSDGVSERRPDTDSAEP